MSDNIIERNNVKVIGKGTTTLMFAHGFGCDQTMWQHLTPYFQDDYTIVLFDYTGSGKSDLSFFDIDRYSSFEGYAQDITDICNTLNLNNIIFVGHSVSCMIGAIASASHPGLFNNMVLIAPSARYCNENNFEQPEENFAGWGKFTAPVIIKKAEQKPQLLITEENFYSNDHAVNKRFARLTFYSDSIPELTEINIPVLILQCNEDAIAPNTTGIYIYENITGSRFIKMQAIGHCPHMSYPIETADYIHEYLKTLH